MKPQNLIFLQNLSRNLEKFSLKVCNSYFLSKFLENIFVVQYIKLQAEFVV